MVTMQQIAEKAGCSRTTVSFVLNDSPLAAKLPDETKKRVLKVANEMGYRPNGIARALITGNTRVIGLMSTQPERNFAARMLCGAMEQADELGYFVKLLPMWESKDPDQIIAKLLEQQVVGTLLQGARGEFFDSLWKALKENKIPSGMMGSSSNLNWGNRVVTNDIDGSHQAVRHLYDLGHRKISFLSGSFDFGSFAMRRDGYLSAMRDLGLPVSEDDVIEMEHYSEAGRSQEDVGELRKEIHALFPQRLKNHTAAFCGNEITASLVVQAAKHRGLRVPEDFSVVGYSDSAVARLCDPPLTTIVQPQNEIGRESARLLIDVIEEKSRTNHFKNSQLVQIPTELLVRESTAAVPKDRS